MANSKDIQMEIEMNHLTPNDSFSPGDVKGMSKCTILKNLYVLCFGFIFLFSAYTALANLQSTLNMEGNVGVASQSVVYAAVIVSSLFLPKLIIKKLGCKLTLLFSILTYAPYVAANFYPRMETLVPAAVVLGLGVAPLWSAKCTYINEISSTYSTRDSDSVDVVTSKFFGVFFMMFKMNQIAGNLVSFFVLQPSVSKNATAWSSTNAEGDSSFAHSNEGQFCNGHSKSVNATCGIHFQNNIRYRLEPVPEDKRSMLIVIYLGCVILAAVLVALFLDPLKRKKKEEDSGVRSRVVATLKHLKKPEQILLVPLTVFSGLDQAFILGDYTKAYVACTLGVESVGLVFVCFGVTSATMSFLSGRLVKYIPRVAMLSAAATNNSCIYIMLFFWKPEHHHTWSIYIVIAFWGFSNAIAGTQLNALYGILFRSNEEAAFANYRLFDSLGYIIAFSCSGYIRMSLKIYMLMGFLAFGMTGYLALELKIWRRKKNVHSPKQEMLPIPSRE